MCVEEDEYEVLAVSCAAFRVSIIAYSIHH